MAIDVGGPSGLGVDLAPIQPISNPLERFPGLQAVNEGARGSDSYEGYWDQISRGYGETSYDRQMREMDPNFGPGTIQGGPRLPDMRLLADPRAFTVAPRQPALTSSQLGLPTMPGPVGEQRNRAGVIDLNLLEPFDLGSDVTGTFFGRQTPQVGPGGAFDPAKFLAERDIDVFGNLPSRLFDYAAAPLEVTIRALTGNARGGEQIDGGGRPLYRFQQDQRYWAWALTATEDGLAVMAKQAVEQYTGGQPNQALYQAVYEQLKRDRDLMQGLSSGDEAIDYRAKQVAWTMYQAARTGSTAALEVGRLEAYGEIPSKILPTIPFVGTQLAGFFDPVTPEMDELWLSLKYEDRVRFLEDSGFQQFATTMVATAPLLVGGTAIVAGIAARAAAAGGVIGKGVQLYNTGLDVATQIMRAGTVVALSNWAASAAIPGYAETIGEQIDHSRPFTNSPFAAAINTFGYFASPKEVFGPFYRAPLAVTRGLRGETEIAIFRMNGGLEAVRSAGRRFRPTGPNSVDLSEHAFTVSQQRLALSNALHVVADRAVARWEGLLRDVEHPSWGTIPLAERPAIATQALRQLEHAIQPAAREMLMQHTLGRAPVKPGALFRERLDHDNLGKLSRVIDDEMARMNAMLYGPGRIAFELGVGRTAGAQYTPQAFMQWFAAQAERLGHQLDVPGLTRDIEGLAGRAGVRGQLGGETLPGYEAMWRLMYHREFDHWNGLLQAAARGSSEEGRIAIVRAHHLFDDLADELLTAIESSSRRGRRAADPSAAPAAPRVTAAQAKALARRLIEGTPELQKWWAELDWQAAGLRGTKSLDNIPIATLRKYVEAIRPTLISRRIKPGASEPTTGDPLNALHAQLDANGQWTLAFKPGWNRAHVGDEFGGAGEGSFASYHYLDDAQTFFQSPWLDYPMETAGLIDLGGQGFIASRVDGIMRGFRTWRIAEFQRAMTHRIATRYDGVSAPQIDAFVDEVMELARERPLGFGRVATHVTAQALAATERVGRHQKLSDKITPKFRGDIQDIGNRIFGKRQFRNLDTGDLQDVDWADVVQQGFRQSIRLNLTAGVTSRLKTMSTVGDLAILTSDFLVPLLRFTLSPVFRVSEYVESSMLNAMRGVTGDPIARMLYARAGLMRDYGAAGVEIVGDPMAGALATGPARGRQGRLANEGAFFNSPRPGGRIDTSEAAHTAASADHHVPAAVDLPGGPDAPVPTPAEIRYAEARRSLDDAELELAEASSAFGDVRDIGDVGVQGGQRWRASMSDPNNDAFQELLIDQTAFLQDGGEQALMERWAAARTEFEAARAALDLPPTLAAQREAGEALAERGFEYRRSLTEMQSIQRQELRDVAWAQERMNAISGDLPLFAPEDPNAIRMYHGTGEPFPAFDRARYADESLYGPGVYLTENADKIPIGYARNRDFTGTMGNGVVFQVDVPRSAKIIDIEVDLDKLPAGWRDSLVSAAESRADAVNQSLRMQVRSIVDEIAVLANPPLTPAELQRLIDDGVRATGDRAAGRPIDFKVLKDWRDGILHDQRWPLPPTLDGKVNRMLSSINDSRFFEGIAVELQYQWPLKTVYEHLHYYTGGGVGYAKRQFNDMIEAAGFDGIAHVGGSLTGNAPHQVRILFDPKNAKIVGHNLVDVLEDAKQRELEIDALHRGMEASRERYADAAAVAGLGQRYENQQQAIARLAAIEDDVERQAAAVRLADFERRAEAQLAAVRAQRNAQLSASADALSAQARARGPRPATDLREIPGQPEHTEALFEAAIAAQPKTIRDRLNRIYSPNAFKEEAMTDLQIAAFRDLFPSVLRGSKNRAAEIFDQLGIPERDWTKFLLVDRTRYQAWQDAPTAANFKAMVEWADRYRERGAKLLPEGGVGNVLDDFYESPEFESLSHLWALGARAAQDEAFGTHFFMPFRSYFGRSINHPLLGAYPAAWAYKVAVEWFRFLYDNRMLGNTLRLGMAPAVAIQRIMEAQNRMFAMASGGQSINDFIEEGPLGSSVFIFNLLLPGDWSAIPFPLSRSVRMLVRGAAGDPAGFDPAAHLYQNLVGAGPYGIGGGGLGVIRDVRLFSESWGEVRDIMGLGGAPDPTTEQEQFARIAGAWVDEGLPIKPVDWRSVAAYDLARSP